MRIKKSLAHRNIIILILSILPFFVGIGISVYHSADTEYFSMAINISGSQRMRTMLISNYLQSYNKAYAQGNEGEVVYYKELLKQEIGVYQHYYDALQLGDSSLSMKPNAFPEIIKSLDDFHDAFSEYVRNAETVIDHPTDEAALLSVVHQAMVIKDHFDATCYKKNTITKV